MPPKKKHPHQKQVTQFTRLVDQPVTQSAGPVGQAPGQRERQIDQSSIQSAGPAGQVAGQWARPIIQPAARQPGRGVQPPSVQQTTQQLSQMSIASAEASHVAPSAPTTTSKSDSPSSRDTSGVSMQSSQSPTSSEQSLMPSSSMTKSEAITELGLESDGDKLMLRPKALGTRGRKIALVANFFPVELKQGLAVYHYDISIKKNAVGGDSSKNKKSKDKPVGAGPPQVAGGNITLEKKLPRWLSAVLMAELFRTNKDTFKNPYGLAYDGHKNLLAIYPLNGIDSTHSREFPVVIKNSEKNIDEEFLIAVQFAAARINVDIRQVFSRSLQERNSIATLIYDMVLKQRYFFDKNYIPFGRRIFYHPLERIDQFPLGGGAYRFPGFFQSMRPVHGWKVMINVDQANTSFLKGGPVLDLLREVMGRQQDSDPKVIRSKLEKIVKNLKISQTQRFPHRTAKCTGVSAKSAATQMFSENGKQTSVAQYFSRQYQQRVFVKDIRYPNLPCLMFGRDKFIPLEFCEVKPDQRYPRKLDGFQTSNMLKIASSKATERQRDIEADMDYLKMSEDPYLKAFGISVSAKMATLDGRVLAAPRIEMGRNKVECRDYYMRLFCIVDRCEKCIMAIRTKVIVNTTLGAWNYTDAPFVQGCRIRNFGVICTTDRCRDDEIRNFTRNWAQSAIKLGMEVQNTSEKFLYKVFDAEKLTPTLQQAKHDFKDLDLVFVILEGQNTDFYSYAKQAGDVAVGVNTQCIQSKNVSMCKFATLNNLNLKINGKLGGINSKLPQESLKEIKKIDLSREPILYLGADVNHTAPDDNCEPISCAAVVGSVDLNPSVYCARIYLQSQERLVDGQVNRRPQEWISQMENGVLMSIDHFVRRNKVLPRRIIMFRDGVGETMFRLVMVKEMRQIRNACHRMAERYPQLVKSSGFKIYEPPITFIVVQKRHHTRLFCANTKDSAGERYGCNVPPGTTVDTTIVHPEEFDFYLCSHLGLQGTSKPAHYHVLWDDNNFTADDLQQLIYNICHTYCRSTRSVSIPPPCYYADLVAYRARKYLEVLTSDRSSYHSGASGQSINLQALQNQVNVKDDIVSRGMFFV